MLTQQILKMQTLTYYVFFFKIFSVQWKDDKSEAAYTK